MVRKRRILFDAHDSQTGIFQENIDTNGFYKTLRSMILMGRLPDTSVRMLDFSFIDQVAESMVRLVFSNETAAQNYHLFNPHQLSMLQLSQMLSTLGMHTHLLTVEDFLDDLRRLYDDAELGDYIKEFILHTRLFSIPDETHFTLVCDRTCRRLTKLGFAWKQIDTQMLTKMLRYCVQTGFITKEQEDRIYGA